LGAVQILIVKLLPEERRLDAVLEYIRTNRDLKQGAFQEVQRELNQVASTLSKEWTLAGDLEAPKLAHMNEKTVVRSFAFLEPPSFGFGGDQIRGDQVGELVKAFARALSRLQRLHFKNLGALLRLQEKLDPSLYPEAKPDEEEEEANEEIPIAG
jgi:hypothetical protein